MFKKPQNIPVVTENKSVFDMAVRTRLCQKNKAFGDLYDKLCAIHDDNQKYVKIPGMPYIIFDGENFRISTGAFIGRRPEDCVDICGMYPESLLTAVAAPAICDIDERTLLITTGTTREDVITFFAKRVTWGTLYLKNPDATILLLKDGGMDVYFDKGCEHENLRHAMLSDLCKELGLWEV